MRALFAVFDNLFFRIIVHLICLALVILGLIFYMFSLIIIGVAVEIVFLILLFLFGRMEKQSQAAHSAEHTAAPSHHEHKPEPKQDHNEGHKH